MPNLLAQRTRVFITPPDGPEVEVTVGLISLLTKNSPLGTDEDLRGETKATGTLTLIGKNKPGFEFDLDRRNTNLWNRGNLVRAEIRKRSGGWATHPRGALRILKTPPVPKPNQNFEIPVGCEGAYLDTEKPGVESNSIFQIDQIAGITIRDAINLLGDRAGMPNLVDNIDPDTRIYSLGTRLEGNRWEEMGRMALPSLQYLWVNGARQLRASTFNLDSSPAYTLNASLDCSRFDENFNDLASVDDVEVIAQRRSRVSVTVTQAPTELSLTGDVFLNPTILTTSETTIDGQSTSTITKTYGEKDWLIEELQEDEAPRKLIAPQQFPDDTTRIPSRRSRTRYTIVNDQVRKVLTEIEEPALQVRPTAEGESLDLSLIPSKKDVVEYLPLGANWLEVQSGWDRRTGEASPTVRFDPQISPPNPTARPKPQQDSDQEARGEASFEGGFPRRKRRVRLNIRLNNPDQVQSLANLAGRLQYGASQSAEWECEIFDSLVDNYLPQQIWQFAYRGFDYRYLADGHVFELTPTSAKFGAIGYYLGRVATGGVVIPPARFQTRATGRTVVGGSASLALGQINIPPTTGRTVAGGSASLQASNVDLPPTTGRTVAGGSASLQSSTTDLPSVLGATTIRGSAYLVTPLPAVKVYRTSNLVFGSGSFVQVTFQEISFQEGGDLWSSGLADRLIFPADGIYCVGATAQIALSATGSAEARLRVSGTIVATQRFEGVTGSQGFAPSTIVQVSAGQNLNLAIFQNTGQNQTLIPTPEGTPTLWAYKIS